METFHPLNILLTKIFFFDFALSCTNLNSIGFNVHAARLYGRSKKVLKDQNLIKSMKTINKLYNQFSNRKERMLFVAVRMF